MFRQTLNGTSHVLCGLLVDVGVTIHTTLEFCVPRWRYILSYTIYLDDRSRNDKLITNHASHSFSPYIDDQTTLRKLSFNVEQNWQLKH